MRSMSPQRAAAAAPTARRALAPPSGLDDAWAHPLLGRLLRGQSRHRELDLRHPWLLDTAVVLVVALVSLPDLISPDSNGPFGEASSRGQLPTAVLCVFAAALIVPL